MKQTQIFSGFPGTGKSTIYEQFKDNIKFIVLDSDSSQFDKEFFPQNYIDHIKSKIGKVDVIFISSHEEVRLSLNENNIGYTLVYPNIELKTEYITRYTERGSHHKFIELVSSNWDNWIVDLKSFQHNNVNHIELQQNEFLGDVVGLVDVKWEPLEVPTEIQ